jgi:magnesium transporter
MFEVGSLIDKENLAKNPGVLVFFVVKHLYEFALRQLDHIQLKIDEIEENIFKHYEKEMVEIISLTRRDVLDFQRAIYAHESILNSFASAGQKFFGPEFIHYTSVMLGELERVKNLLANSRATIESLQDTNDSLLTDKVNDIMRVLTSISFVTLPLVLFAAIFGMSNMVSMPIVGHRGDFWIILCLMLVAASTMFFIFKKKKWL